jgi:hypothetical protein
MAVDLLGIASAVGSSGVTVLLYNFWTSKRLEKSAKSAEDRNKVREPYVLESLQVGTATKINDLLQKGLDEMEERSKRQATEYKERVAELEDKISTLNNENNRVRTEWFNDRKDSENKIAELQTEIVNMQLENRRLRESGGNP